MKNLLFCGCIAACTLMLSSCLETGTQNYTGSNIPGVIRFDIKNMKTVIDANYFYPFGFYDPKIETMGFTEGDCIMFDYSVNLESQENANYQANGVIHGTLAGLSPVDLYYCSASMTDTTTLLDKEQPIAYAMDANMGWSVVANKLFLFSDFKYFTDQKTEWSMSYRPELIAEDDGYGKHVYSLFLRAALRVEGKAPELTTVVANAFDIGRFIEIITAQEKRAGSTAAYIKINYIKEIKSEAPVWTASELIQYPISQGE
jgi:hypothetical protein